MRSPVNASPAASRIRAHDSGPLWLAKPSVQWTYTIYSLPVLPALSSPRQVSFCKPHPVRSARLSACPQASRALHAIRWPSLQVSAHGLDVADLLQVLRLALDGGDSEEAELEALSEL